MDKLRDETGIYTRKLLKSDLFQVAKWVNRTVPLRGIPFRNASGCECVIVFRAKNSDSGIIPNILAIIDMRWTVLVFGSVSG